MSLRFYSNLISQGSRNFASGVFITGMLLIGFGFLIWVLRELFAILFAIIFCIAGIGCIGTAIKVFWSVRKLKKMSPDETQGYRKGVKIHGEQEYFD